jgi:hypothetical protein
MIHLVHNNMIWDNKGIKKMETDITYQLPAYIRRLVVGDSLRAPGIKNPTIRIRNSTSADIYNLFLHGTATNTTSP